MKASTDSTKKDSKTMKNRWESWQLTHPKFAFAIMTGGLYLLLMILYTYFMMANLSSAPKFVYTAF